MQRLLSTEAKQADDGRFTILPDLHPYFEAHAGGIEKFCMFFGSRGAGGRGSAPAGRHPPGWRPPRAPPTTSRPPPPASTRGRPCWLWPEHLGIPQQAVLAVGDSENDRKMLEAAGVAAVMANGMPSIQSLADIVSERDCNHDGVAELFEPAGPDGCNSPSRSDFMQCIQDIPANLVLCEYYQMARLGL